MINVLVYALPNRNSGGYSVVKNLYEDIKTHDYPDIHWFFIVGMSEFESTDTITVYNEEWAVKTYFHRYYFNTVKLKRFVKKHDIKAVISLNMGISGIDVPSIISLHNVLPFYHCDSNVFDDKRDMIKQSIINKMIVNSLKRAYCIIVPSHWIKNTLMQKFGIKEERIVVSPIIVPEIAALLKRKENTEGVEHSNSITDDNNKLVSFIYPSSGFPYKNHAVIVRAVEKLKQERVENYCVRFAGNVGNGATMQGIKRIIEEDQLPIEFSGLLSKEELAIAYREGVLLFPSKIETDGFPLLESMACGGYIIASNLDYAKEALHNYDNYDLFDPDDAEELSSLMKKIIDIGNPPQSAHTGAEDLLPRTEVIVPVLRKIACK